MSLKKQHVPYSERNAKQPQIGAGTRCVPTQRLLDFRDKSAASVSILEQRHIEGCPQCASRSVVLHTGKLLSELPFRWTVYLGNALRHWPIDAPDSTYQLLGAIDFESRNFRVCHEDEWIPSPFAMRVNIVFDAEMQFFSVTILDAPMGIKDISLMTPLGLQHLLPDGNGTAFEFSICGEAGGADVESLLAFTDLRALVTAHKLQLVVDMKDVTEGGGNDRSEANDIIELLEKHEAIERVADYVLPCGLHSDTYINSSALCSREESMQLLAAKIDFLFWDTQFDTVLANGWAMGLIGRRLVATRQAQGRKTPIRQALCEGYAAPVLLDDIVPGSQVLIVLDVVITGHLACALERMVQAAGADVVGIVALVRPHAGAPLVSPKLRVLCEVEMDLVDTQKSRCQRCDILPQKVFNPIAGCMTTKSTTPRSPSEFLCEDTTARELWEYVQAAGAYEHHRREGDTHYIGFVDTQKLLETSRIGKTLVEKLVSVVSNSGNRPSVLLAPRRSRARLLARKMCRALEAATGNRPRILEATQKWSTGKWELSAANYGELFHADVLIVDTAAGHGRTIDQLASLAARAKARRIGGAVLLSRLSPPCEDAFNLRLSGGYHRLFHLPIRPVAIRGDRVDLCPVCRRKDAIRRFAEESDIDGLEEWADSLLKARRGAVEPSPYRRKVQLTLFERQDFLSRCSAAVASGVTLHAIGAASTNGSAPLSLPELCDDRISWRARATMVENLPAGILDWTGNTLTPDLSRLLAGADYPSIWKAAASLLSREGSNLWLDHLESMIRRLNDSRHRPSQSFWNHMACNAYLLAASGSQAQHEVQMRIEQILTREGQDAIQDGLRQMRDVVRNRVRS